MAKELAGFDREPEMFQKYVIEHPKGQMVTIDVGYEIFLASGVFFNHGNLLKLFPGAFTHCGGGYYYPKLPH